MQPDFHERELLARMSGNGAAAASGQLSTGSATCFHPLKSQAARAIVSLGDVLQRIDNFGVLALADQELGSLFQADDGDSSDAHDKHNCPVGEPHVSPSGVGVPVAGDVLRVWLSQARWAGEVGEKRPGKETSDELAGAPPARHQGEHPLVLGGQVFEEDGRIQNQIATAAKRRKGDEQSKHDPVWAGAGHDAEDGGDHEGEVERVLAANDIGGETPEQSADEHANVDSDGHAVCEAGIELGGGVGGDDGLDEQDEGVHGVPEAVEQEQLPLVAREADLVDGVVDQVHLGVQRRVDVLQAEQVALLDGLIAGVPFQVWRLAVRRRLLVLLLVLHLEGSDRLSRWSLSGRIRWAETWVRRRVGG